MGNKPFTWVAAVLFLLGALVHIYRVFTHFQIVVGSHTIPIWCSYIAIAFGLFMSWMLCREARGTTGP